MLAQAKGVSGSFFVSCSCCSAKSMCTSACQKPVPHRARASNWPPALRSNDIFRDCQQKEKKLTKHEFVKAFDLQYEGLKTFFPSPQLDLWFPSQWPLGGFNFY